MRSVRRFYFWGKSEKVYEVDIVGEKSTWKVAGVKRWERCSRTRVWTVRLEICTSIALFLSFSRSSFQQSRQHEFLKWWKGTKLASGPRRGCVLTFAPIYPKPRLSGSFDLSACLFYRYTFLFVLCLGYMFPIFYNFVLTRFWHEKKKKKKQRFLWSIDNDSLRFF